MREIGGRMTDHGNAGFLREGPASLIYIAPIGEPPLSTSIRQRRISLY